MTKDKTVYSGKTFEIVHRDLKLKDRTITLEVARRSPGIRLIIAKNGKILLTKEYRHELKAYDYRLPGGKVFDSLKEYSKNIGSNMMKHAISAAKKECIEETGLIVKNIKHFQTSKAGLTVDWTLYYFIVDKFAENPGGQQLEHGEDIKPEWKTFSEAKKLCLNGKMSEDRSVGVLLRFLLKGGKLA
jgi:ADP-ribose pyrophosphatase